MHVHNKNLDVVQNHVTFTMWLIECLAPNQPYFNLANQFKKSPDGNVRAFLVRLKLKGVSLKVIVKSK